MCLEIWNMRIAVSNVVSEYSLGGVNFTHRVNSISGTRNRSEIMESCVLKMCIYCTIDYPGNCTNNPAC